MIISAPSILLLGIIAERDSLPVRVLDALVGRCAFDLKKRLERSIPAIQRLPAGRKPVCRRISGDHSGTARPESHLFGSQTDEK
jgi:hypothetical protein